MGRKLFHSGSLEEGKVSLASKLSIYGERGDPRRKRRVLPFFPHSSHSCFAFTCGSRVTSRDSPKWRACSQAYPYNMFFLLFFNGHFVIPITGTVLLVSVRS